MKYVFTDFFKDFVCVGGNCPDTCCAGWQIIIDDETMGKYSALQDSQREWVCSCIDETTISGVTSRTFRMKENGRCPFLNECNLCDIYLQISPDALSYTCQTYPRKIVSYYDVVLATVCVSCPEVARILLEKKTPIIFDYVEDANEANTKGANWLLYNELINGLVITTDILQKRSYSIWERVYVMLEMTYQIQKHMDESNLQSLRKDIECYKSSAYCDAKIATIRDAIGSVEGCWSVVHDIVGWFGKIENISKEQKDFLAKSNILNTIDGNTYYDWLKHFRGIEEDTEFENLAVEFIFEYYMEALQGESLFFNVTKMVLLLVAIRTFEVIHYNLESEFTIEKKIEIVSKLSRIMEHTQLLDEMVKELMTNNKLEELYKMAYLLY